ncbi:hypothetical protein M1L21_32720 [Streptomyces sp. AS02]|nr:hypothetical protein [Streptomyces sp. AS02]
MAASAEPVRGMRWWRTIDWGKWGTIAGIFVGAVGLLFTAIATYYDARVSAGELTQAREDAGKDARRQAARVATWGDIENRIHVTNRSPDPVSDVQVHFFAGYFEDTSDGMSLRRERFLLTVADLPPCSDFVISTGQLFEHSADEKEGGGVRLNRLGVSFSDADGVRWIRTKGNLQAASTKEGKIITRRLKDEYGVGNRIEVFDTSVTVKDVAPCTTV